MGHSNQMSLPVTHSFTITTHTRENEKCLQTLYVRVFQWSNVAMCQVGIFWRMRNVDQMSMFPNLYNDEGKQLNHTDCTLDDTAQLHQGEL